MNFITLGNRQRDTVLVGLHILRHLMIEQPELIESVRQDTGVDVALMTTGEIAALVEAISPGGVQCHNDEFPGLLDGYTNTMTSLRDAIDAIRHLRDAEKHLDGIEAYLNSMDGALMNTGEVEIEDDGLKVTVDVPEAEPA